MASLPDQLSADGRFLISTDPARLDFAVIHDFLSNRSYWAQGSPLEKIRRAASHSLCFGIYESASGRQAGYARVVSDYTTFAYVCDVFVLEELRGNGLGKWLMSTMLAHPALPDLRRWVLATKDAHGLYAQYGFTALPQPERWMVRMAENSPPPQA